MRHAISLIGATVLCAAISTANAGEKKRSEIAAASVEHTATAEVLRLAVTPAPVKFEEKIVCGEGLIRVRLPGVVNGGREIQELFVPNGGPIRRARVIETNPFNTVIQLFPRRNPMGTCARTTAAAVGGEIVISTAYTGEEAARLAAKREKKAAAPVAVAAPPVKPATEPAIKEKKAAEKPAAAKADKAAAEDDSLVFKKDAAPLAKEGDKEAGFAAPIDTPKMAFVFGFAATLAGIALFLKRKKKGAIGKMDQIDILSTQRIGARQQLMLVSVHDVKFLLAISDKTISSLGIVPDEMSATREQPSRVEETPRMSVESTIQSLIGEASRRAAKQEIPREPEERFTGFDSELRRALDHTRISTERTAPVATAAAPSGSRYDSASNAAGLVALARMRSNLKKTTGKSPVFEA